MVNIIEKWGFAIRKSATSFPHQPVAGKPRLTPQILPDPSGERAFIWQALVHGARWITYRPSTHFCTDMLERCQKEIDFARTSDLLWTPTADTAVDRLQLRCGYSVQRYGQNQVPWFLGWQMLVAAARSRGLNPGWNEA